MTDKKDEKKVMAPSARFESLVDHLVANHTLSADVGGILKREIEVHRAKLDS